MYSITLINIQSLFTAQNMLSVIFLLAMLIFIAKCICMYIYIWQWCIKWFFTEISLPYLLWIFKTTPLHWNVLRGNTLPQDAADKMHSIATASKYHSFHSSSFGNIVFGGWRRGGGRGSIYRRRLCLLEIKTFQFGWELKVNYLLTRLILVKFEASIACVLLRKGNLISTEWRRGNSLYWRSNSRTPQSQDFLHGSH